jgi:hypothetical protein
MSDQVGRDPLPSIDELIFEEGFREGLRAMARFLDERVAAALERPADHGGPDLERETRDRAEDLFRRYLGVGLLPDTARDRRQSFADRGMTRREALDLVRSYGAAIEERQRDAEAKHGLALVDALTGGAARPVTP